MTSHPLRRLGRRRTLVLAAAALVVTPGAVMTAATWTDGEFARGSGFNASLPDLQGRSNGGDFASHGSDAPLSMTQSVSDSGDFYPGSAPSYTQVSLRMVDATAPVKVSMTAGPNPPPAGLRLRAVVSDSTTCAASSFTSGSTYLVGGQNGSTVTYGKSADNGSTTFTLQPGSGPGAPGAARTVCYEYSLANDATSDALNNVAQTATWIFTATAT